MNEIERRRGGDRRKLTGPQRAAALFIVLGKEAAPAILRHLDKDEVREIARAAGTLGIVDRASLDAMIDEFVQEFVEGPDVVGTFSEAQQLFSDAIEPQELARIVHGESTEPQISVWEKLADLPEEALTELLAGETSFVAGEILNRLGVERAAGILERLEDERRAKIVARMLLSKPVGTLASRLLEEGIVSALGEMGKGQGGEESRKRIADIVNRLDGTAADTVVAYLSAVAPDQAREVRALVFKFDELTALSQEDRVILFDGLATERVILALKGAPADVVEAALSSLGGRARRMVESELASGAPAPQREIAAARRMVVEAALRLSASGTISLPTAASETQ
ncbi:MAG: FliG C-terminal domain-containing protein [Rhodoblastus sp.]